MTLKANHYVICDASKLQSQKFSLLKRQAETQALYESPTYAYVFFDDDNIDQIMAEDGTTFTVPTGIFGIFPYNWLDPNEIIEYDFIAENPIDVVLTELCLMVNDLEIRFDSQGGYEFIDDEFYD